MLLFWNLSIIQPHFTPNIASDSKHWNILMEVLFLSSFLTLSTYIKYSRCNSQPFSTYYCLTTQIIHANFSRHWARIKTAFYCRRSKANRRSWDGTYTTKNSWIHRSTSSKIISYNDQICKTIISKSRNWITILQLVSVEMYISHSLYRYCNRFGCSNFVFLRFLFLCGFYQRFASSLCCGRCGVCSWLGFCELGLFLGFIEGKIWSPLEVICWSMGYHCEFFLRESDS